MTHNIVCVQATKWPNVACMFVAAELPPYCFPQGHGTCWPGRVLAILPHLCWPGDLCCLILNALPVPGTRNLQGANSGIIVGSPFVSHFRHAGSWILRLHELLGLNENTCHWPPLPGPASVHEGLCGLCKIGKHKYWAFAVFLSQLSYSTGALW